MKILLISSYLPYPLYSGGHIRLYNLLKYISKKNDVTLICEKRRYQTKRDVEEIEKICAKVITVERKRQWSAGNILKAGFSDDSFLIVGHTNKPMKQKIAQELDEHACDLIHVETSYVMQNLPKTKVPVVLSEHNIEYLVYKRFADASFFFFKPFLYYDIYKLRKKEESFWKKADSVIAVSDDEEDIIKKINPNTTVVPNGVDLNTFPIKSMDAKKKKNTVLFIGDFKWIQNRDSAEFILREIWPLVRKEIKAKLWVVGKNIPLSLRTGSLDRSVLFDSKNTQSASSIFQTADVLLSPIRVGGGTQYKILEAMASGTPVVTTSLGKEGIDASKDHHLAVGKTPKDLAEKVIRLLSDDSYYNTLSLNGRALVVRKYNWEKIGSILEKKYHSVGSEL